jgi:hypothetical protein
LSIHDFGLCAADVAQFADRLTHLEVTDFGSFPEDRPYAMIRQPEAARFTGRTLPACSWRF